MGIVDRLQAIDEELSGLRASMDEGPSMDRRLHRSPSDNVGIPLHDSGSVDGCLEGEEE